MADKEPGSAATLNDVAKRAGVSLATASRSLNGSARKVKDELRERVLAAAAELNYAPNLSARAVKTGVATTVGLVVNDISDPYFSAIAAGAIGAAKEAGLIVTMAVSEGDADRELEIVRALRAQRPRAILLTGSPAGDERHRAAEIAQLQAYERRGGRVVAVRHAELPFTTLSIDNAGGARQLARELVGLGYRDFGILCAPPERRASGDRRAGFIAGLSEASIVVPGDRIVERAFTRDGGHDAARHLIDRGLRTGTLLFATNDVMAIGAMTAIREAGMVVGRDIAVAGFDDIPTLQEIVPALTTVNVALQSLGARALALALDKRSASLVEVAPTTVVIRESTPTRRS